MRVCDCRSENIVLLFVQSSVLKFVRDIFSLTEVRYNTVASLSDDILRLAQQTAHAMDAS